MSDAEVDIALHPYWDAFCDFHRANPHVYDALVRQTFVAKRAGRCRVGIDLLVSSLVWESFLETDDPSSQFKINRNYTSLYARMIMALEPELDGMFQLRSLRA